MVTLPQKGKFHLRIPSKAYSPAMDYYPVAHLKCIPRFYAGDGATTSGYYVVGTKEEDQDYIDNTPCAFCNQL